MKFLYVHCFCRRAIEIDEEEDDKNVLKIPREELDAVIRELSTHLENLKTCNDLIAKHGSALQRALAELENSGTDERTKTVTERATLFRISSNAMISVSSSVFTSFYSLFILRRHHRQLSRLSRLSFVCFVIVSYCICCERSHTVRQQQ